MPYNIFYFLTKLFCVRDSIARFARFFIQLFTILFAKYIPYILH